MADKGNGRSKHALGHNPFEDLIFGDEGEPVIADEEYDSLLQDDNDIQRVQGNENLESKTIVLDSKAIFTRETDSPISAGIDAPESQHDAEPAFIQEGESDKDMAAAEAISFEKPKIEAEVRSEPAGSSPSYLEDIITTIDEEIQRVFGETRVGLNLESRLRRRADEEQFVIFTLAGAEYAVSAANVREVSEVVNLSPAPNVPDWLLGVTNLRGDILSVVDLREFLGLEPSGLGGVLWPQSLAGAEQKILVVHPSRDSSALTTAMLVDEVKDIRYLTTRDINKPATTVTEQIESYLRGIYDDDGRLLVVFDFDKLLLSPEMRQFEPM